MILTCDFQQVTHHLDHLGCISNIHIPRAYSRPALRMELKPECLALSLLVFMIIQMGEP